LTYQYGGYEDEGEADPMPLDAVICQVKLVYDDERKSFSLEPQDLAALDAFLKKETQQRQPRQPAGRARALPVQATLSVAVAGERRETVIVVTRSGRNATRAVTQR
jgi:hypothetical protein